MHKNRNNQAEPQKKKCKKDQISCIEFVDYVSKYIKKIDKNTFSVLDRYKYTSIDTCHSELIYQLILGSEDVQSPEQDYDTKKLMNKQIEINNKRKARIMEIIRRRIKNTLAFEMIREIDTEIESLYIKRKRAFKKKNEENEQILALIEKRKLIENDCNLEVFEEEYEDVSV